MRNTELNKVKEFHEIVGELKSISPAYPDIYFKEYGAWVYATTMVTFEYEGIFYKRHHVEAILPNKLTNVSHLKYKLIEAANLTLTKGLPVEGMDEKV